MPQHAGVPVLLPPMKKYVVEFIGTFFFVLTIGMCVINGAGALAPIPIGTALAIMIYAGGHICGGHFNPAVSLSVLLRGGQCSAADIPGYMIAQAIGAAVAALTVSYLKGPAVMAAVAAKPLLVAPALLAEFLFTFALCWVVLNVATSRKTTGNSFYGFAIGLTVMTGAFAVGAISGGAFNPAVALGITLMGLSSWANIWIFLVANFSAAIVAAIVFKAVHPAEV